MMDFQVASNVAVIGMDDGKANAVGHRFIDSMNEALDQAEKEAAAVLIKGRDGVFSGGFDLKEFAKGLQATTALVDKGAAMLLRLFKHPQPVVVACAGHAVAAGAFTLLAADTRVGVTGPYRIGLNETAIGMTLPTFGLQLAAARLSKRWQTKATIQGQLLNPQDALAAGFLDQVVAAQLLIDTAFSIAVELSQLPAEAYAANKLAVRAPYIEAIQSSLR
ncbi:MAG: crotonase/enoyl-CoA hydratase family protein [bacterium]